MSEDDEKIIRIDFASGHLEGEPKPKETPTMSEIEAFALGDASSKESAFRKTLEYGTAYVVLDARRPNVRLPPHLMGEMMVALNYDYRYNISDFEFDSESIRATLSFNGVGFYCEVPWEAIFRIEMKALGTIYLFKESIPEELL